MAEITRIDGGYFGGRSLVQQGTQRGGARHVFYKIDDIKDDLIYPPLGGQVKNPFPGPAKFYAGDLMEYRVDANAELPQIYLLKTYKVVSASGKTVNIERDGYKHKPFIGDVIGKAPESLGGAMTAQTVTAVKATDASGKKVWELTFGTALSGLTEGDILTEADDDGNMMVKRVNAVAAWDYDFMWSEAADPSDQDEFEKARYFLTPSLRGSMYIFRMSPMPQCVLDLNIANIEGVFRVDAFNKPVVVSPSNTETD